MTGLPGAGHDACVITVSTRAAAQQYVDTAGPAVVNELREQGFDVGDVVLVADGPDVGRAIVDAVDHHFDLIITCGGTGISPTDQTPEQTREVIDREVPGIADYLRAQSWDRIATAALSRGVSGVAGSSLVINVPGSKPGALENVRLLGPIVGHALSQIGGGDHQRASEV